MFKLIDKIEGVIYQADELEDLLEMVQDLIENYLDDRNRRVLLYYDDESNMVIEEGK